MNSVSLVKCDDYQKETVKKSLDEAINLIDGLDFVKPNMKIVIKANLLTAKDPKTATTTHPALIYRICELLIEKGAQVCVADSPGGPFNRAALKRVYNVSKMTDVLETGATLNDDFTFSNVNMPESKVLKNADIVNFILNADAVINFAKLKTHGFMGYTGAIKNLFGIIPGTVKAEYHYRMPDLDAFAQMLIDLNEFVKPNLTLIDAVVGMDGNGPSNGNPFQIGAIIASKNPHAADVIANKIISQNPTDVPTLKLAIQSGLINENEIECLGENIDNLITNSFKTIPAAYNNMHFILPFKPLNTLLNKLLASYPQVSKSKCVGCQECCKACPPKAITMQNNLPVIDRKKCIKCYCCQELCPIDAMKIHRSPLANFIRHL